MKKVLIVSYFFPPHPGIGSQRPYRLAKYLQKYGWEPIVLTPKHPERPTQSIKVIETDYKDISANIKSKIGFDSSKGLHNQLNISVSKNFNYSSWKSKFIKFFKDLINFPDEKKGWYRVALKSASKFLDANKVDVIISSSSPIIGHLMARKLKKKYKIPWVADLRDLWTQNHFYDKHNLIKHFERRLELKILSDADTIVTVTMRFADKLRTLHKNKNIVCITNGYDTDDYRDKQTRLTSKFTITYTGGLYNGKMDPSLLFEVVSNLIHEQKIDRELIELRFYTNENERWLLDDILKYGLEDVAKCYDYLPREEVLKKQIESQVLLLLVDTISEVDYYPAKVFEYFGARRPIIAIGGKGTIIKELLSITNTGVFLDNYEQLKKHLLSYYKEFRDFGKVKCYSNNNIENYSYDSITKNYSKLLHELVLK